MHNFPYSTTELTEQVNRFPNQYGLMQALNLFPSQGVASRVVEIRFEDGQLVVLAADEPGAPGQTTERERGKTVLISVPHFPHLETILARDLQGFADVIAGGRVPKSFETELAKRLKTIRGNHSITREFIRLGALRGLVKDGRGRTLLDLFDAFDITPKAIDFDLGDPTTDVIGKCAELIDYMGDSMKGETMSGVELIVGGGWMSKFVQHAKVEKYWLQTEAAGVLAEAERNRLGGQWGRVFKFQTLAIREYTGSTPVRNGQGALASNRNMGTDEARAYPIGTQNAFATYDGPVNHIAHVNEPGQEIFISAEILKHGEGVELKSQSNALPICKRPEFLVDCSTST